MADQNALQKASGSEVEHADVPHERPEDWGWHHTFKVGGPLAGWLSVAIIGLMLTTTHYNHAGSLALVIMMVLIAIGLIAMRQIRRNQWRD